MSEKNGTTTPVLAPGPQNPVVCDDFDWTWTEWHMATALDLHPRICQGEWNGLACTRPDGHHNPRTPLGRPSASSPFGTTRLPALRTVRHDHHGESDT